MDFQLILIPINALRAMTLIVYNVIHQFFVYNAIKQTQI